MYRHRFVAVVAGLLSCAMWLAAASSFAQPYPSKSIRMIVPMNDFIAGQTQVYIANMIAASPQIKAGRMRAIAVSSAQRSETFPDLPTIAESGLPGFNEGGQHGIIAPAATPRETLLRLREELAKALNSPEVKNRVQAEGGRIVASTPEEYRTLIQNETQKWAKVIKAAGIRPE